MSRIQNGPTMDRTESRQSYYLNQRNIVLNSNDRNERIWPNANHFEIALPNPYKNVQSVKIANIILPRFSENTFSNSNQNIKMIVSVNANSTNYTKTVEIDEGDYTNENLKNLLKSRLNLTFSDVPSFPLPLFDVLYNEVTKKLTFSCNKQFAFDFSKKPEYLSTDCNKASKIEIFNKLNNWGLGSFLGFDKKIITSKTITESISVDYHDPPTTFSSAGSHVITADYELRTDNTENEIYYIEIEQLNQFDEVTPDKIMDIMFNNNEVDQHTTSFFSEVIQLKGKGPANSGSGIAHFNPPLDYLSKLKIKFRHHDYSLVDLKNRDYTLVLQLTFLEPDPFKVGRIRKPEFYEK